MKRILLTFSIVAGLTFSSFAEDAHSFLPMEKSNSSIVSADESWMIGGQDEPAVIFYPNPVKDYLNVKFPQKGNYTVRIYNIVGELMAERTINEDFLVKVNLSELQSGMYFISYEFGGKMVTKTFSKQ